MLAVTGANGFVGRALCAAAAKSGHRVRQIVRDPRAGMTAVGDIGSATQWDDALCGVSTVIHLAARVHHMRDSAADPLRLYRETNVEGTLHLARQAWACGVKRMVFVSSIKVNGDRTEPGRPFRPDDPARPSDAYGLSKLEAERGLWAIAADTGLEIVVVRPPLVYGGEVGANFCALVSLVRRRLPLPLGRIRNARSLIAVDNLADLLLRCAEHPAAPGETFLCRDDGDVSTPDLLRAIGRALHVPVRLLSVPLWLLSAATTTLRRGDVLDRLAGSLQVDDSATRERLDWTPPLQSDAAMARAAARWTAAAPFRKDGASM